MRIGAGADCYCQVRIISAELVTSQEQGQVDTYVELRRPGHQHQQQVQTLQTLYVPISPWHCMLQYTPVGRFTHGNVVVWGTEESCLVLDCKEGESEEEISLYVRWRNPVDGAFFTL